MLQRKGHTKKAEMEVQVSIGILYRSTKPSVCLVMVAFWETCFILWELIKAVA